MTAHDIQTAPTPQEKEAGPEPAHGAEIVVPLNRLKASPRNARKVRHSAAAIEALAASIRAKGVLQAPVVEIGRDREGAATGDYLVTIGEGRRQALRLLAKRKAIKRTHPVRVVVDTFDVLRKMRPMRQVEAAELMLSANNFTSAYAKALLAATRQGDLLRQDKPKRIGGMTSEQMARMEREMASLTSDFRAIEASYGDDVLHLVVASGYLNRLLSNPAIERHLTNRHPELVDEFRAIIAASSLDEAAGG